MTEVLPTDELLERALTAARYAQANAYAPYSQRHVGAAVITAAGEVFPACNVENGCDELRVCAERNAIVAAVGAGHRNFITVVVVSPDHRFWPPCGACRGVIAEFAPEAEIVMSTRSGEICRGRLGSLPVVPFDHDQSV